DFMFFFSSIRRHTGFDCDWSSDVCSSDLTVDPSTANGQRVIEFAAVGDSSPANSMTRWPLAVLGSTVKVLVLMRWIVMPKRARRSEERRVGKSGGGVVRRSVRTRRCKKRT